MAVEVAPVSRLDWSRNAAALTDPSWWQGKLKPRPAVDWYLTRVDSAMQKLKRRLGEAAEAGSDGAPISMLTHSAGGWLGRVYLLDWGVAGVDRFVSLGSPHAPPPEGVLDQTRGILTWVNQAAPGAFHDSVSYTTICGRFVRGESLTGGGAPAPDAAVAATAAAARAAASGALSSASDLEEPRLGSTAEVAAARAAWIAKFAGAGYQQVCGKAEVWGDFIVPQPAAHLDGATQVDLEGVFHSPLGEQLPFFGPWYGSPQILEQWVHHLTGEAAPQGQVAAVPSAVRVAAP
ncbi:hypothetical protein HYH03_005304 [Edaphochlamys debaryana]|uniref:GPI inositol-deacylase n=1 Tax=Edaphochlamys debaryana TaxID=47281 RepID=A0A835Y815_9CHLO|nr:hypothetical protein HYH03_005304 [Edaphochlamys debaryana]|eukprot:KAG2496478.1 hypothetical protein HYH03_005304 [Edaphochlamys debaryana]